jgi:DNA-binding NtrC family response regulator
LLKDEAMKTLDARKELSLRLGDLVTCSDRMLPVLDRTSRAARSDATVLITGESGTGKELIARAIHANSPRRDGPFAIVNMAAVPEHLVESELFGHVAGAFTGSTGTRIGRFESADGGSLFIDEIGDLALESQAKLLRVLENHVVTPVGSNTGRRIDVRVIAATHRDLKQMVVQGAFREDLYYRLDVVAIHLPPLRERSEDIEYLVDHFLDELSSAQGRPRPTLDAELLSFLRSYHWPGNVRQLRNCVESMFVLADKPTLGLQDLPPVVTSNNHWDTTKLDLAPDLSLDDLTRRLIAQRLEHCRGNRTHAAHSLGISVRTLQRRLKRWDEIGDEP